MPRVRPEGSEESSVSSRVVRRELLLSPKRGSASSALDEADALKSDASELRRGGLTGDERRTSAGNFAKGESASSLRVLLTLRPGFTLGRGESVRRGSGVVESASLLLGWVERGVTRGSGREVATGSGFGLFIGCGVGDFGGGCTFGIGVGLGFGAGVSVG